MKCSAVCLVALSLLCNLCDAQWKPVPKPIQKPVIQEPIKNPSKQPPQEKQVFEKPIGWAYPQDPVIVHKTGGPIQVIIPGPASTVAVDCREKDAVVEVKKDFFGIGQFINPADLTLGNCPAVGEDEAAQVLIYRSDLADCGSTLALTEDCFVYTFTLNYVPQSLPGAPVVRTSGAAVIVECHYRREQDVSSLPLQPLWIPFSAVKVAEEFLQFNLRLLHSTDDLQLERPNNQYYLGDIVLIEATVHQFFHTPLRVFVDNCVATLSPDVSSQPSYAFIENNGCLIDGRITGSSSQFLHRSAENKLQFMLEAFRFQNAVSGKVYITCQLQATLTSSDINSEQRACSYINGVWTEASGVNVACQSCESGLGLAVGTRPYTAGRKIRDVSQKSSESFKWEGKITLGPIDIKERAQ